MLLLFLLSVRPAASAIYDPALTWTTIVTPHFNIHYHNGLETEARRLAVVAEEVHAPMAEILEWTPSQPTEVVLVDQTDLANGYTTALPYNKMVLFPVLPDLSSSIGDYDDWLKTLFIHEYAHVLGLDPVHGYSKVFRTIFGKADFPMTEFGVFFWFFAAPPNTFLPPWLHEGMAVNMESDLTGRGRLNSNYYRMIFRTDAVEGTTPTLDRFGGDFPDWPSYSTRYIYGSKLLSLAKNSDGEKALGALFKQHSSRFPFTIDAPALRVTGLDYAELYAKMIEELEAEFRPKINTVRTLGLVEGDSLTSLGKMTSGPLWISNSSIAFTHAGSDGPPELLLQNLENNETRTLALRPGAVSRPTLGTDGQIIFPRLEITKPLAGGLFYSDLYAVDQNGNETQRLTHGARLREADFSRSANAFIAVQAQGSRRRLIRFRRGDSPADHETLLEEEGVRYDSPRWSPDGSAAAFSRKTDKGTARLALLRLSPGEKGEGEKLVLPTPEGSQAGFPTWSPDGARIIFSWDRTGVFDLYSYELKTGAIHQLTRVLGGAFEPDWSPDGEKIAFSSYSAKGFDISTLQLKQALWEEINVQSSPPLEADPTTKNTRDQTAAEQEETSNPVAFEEKSYSPWPRALPTFWLPDLAGDNAGAAPGAWTSGFDPLLRHKYYTAAYWSPGLDRFYGQSIYINDSAHPTITAMAWKIPIVHSDLFETKTETYDYWEEDRGIRISAQLPLPQALDHWSFAAAWAWEEVARISRISQDLDNNRELADAAFQGKLNSLAFSILYDSAFPYDRGFSFDPKSGTTLSVSYRVRSEIIGSDIGLQESVVQWTQYLDLAAPPDSTLVLKAKGGSGWGSAPLQSIFQIGGESSEFPIRGYGNNVDRGKKVFAGSAELQIPVWSPFRGVNDLPMFLKKIHLAPFFDLGGAWDEDNERMGRGSWKKGAGMELRGQTLLGYYFPTTLVIGYAHGFDEDGGDRGYITFAVGK